MPHQVISDDLGRLPGAHDIIFDRSSRHPTRDSVQVLLGDRLLSTAAMASIAGGDQRGQEPFLGERGP